MQDEDGGWVLDDPEFIDVFELFYYGSTLKGFTEYLDPIFDLHDCMMMAFTKLARLVPDEEQRLRLLDNVWTEIRSNVGTHISNCQNLVVEEFVDNIEEDEDAVEEG